MHNYMVNRFKVEKVTDCPDMQVVDIALDNYGCPQLFNGRKGRKEAEINFLRSIASVLCENGLSVFREAVLLHVHDLGRIKKGSTPRPDSFDFKPETEGFIISKAVCPDYLIMGANPPMISLVEVTRLPKDRKISLDRPELRDHKNFQAGAIEVAGSAVLEWFGVRDGGIVPSYNGVVLYEEDLKKTGKELVNIIMNPK